MIEDVEIVVIGGGPGGLRAALAAAKAGAQVTLIDAYAQPGGQYFRQPPERLIAQSNAHQRQGQELIRKVREAGIRIINDTLVFNINADKTLVCNDPHGSYQLKAQAVIIASGAYERPVPFPGWTLPGVLMTGGIQALLYQHVLPGRRVLLAGTGPLQLVVAKKLLDAGAKVVAVLEGAQLIRKAIPHALAMWGQWERLIEGAKGLGTMMVHRVPYRISWGIVEAHGVNTVTGAIIAKLDRDWRPVKGTEQEIICDTIGIGFGFVPFNALSRMAGAQQSWRFDLGGEVPVRSKHFETTIPGIYAIGDGAGVGGVRLSEMEGELAGICAAANIGYGKDRAEEEIGRIRTRIKKERRFQKLYSDVFQPGTGIFELAREDTLVCRCEGVTYGNLRGMIQKGSHSAQEVKNGTRATMGVCQGRMCGHTILHEISKISGKSIPEIGLFGARPPVFQMSIGALASLDIDEKKEVK